MCWWLVVLLLLPHSQGGAAAAVAVALPNNRRPGLLPPADARWRGAELGPQFLSGSGGGGSKLATWARHYPQYPLHVYRSFNLTIGPGVRAWVRRGGILWYNIKTSKQMSWQKGAEGGFNDEAQGWAAQVKSLAPAQVFATIFHEPDHNVCDTHCHQGGVPGNTPANYRNMWRNIQMVFQQQNVTNVVWVIDYSVKIANTTEMNSDCSDEGCPAAAAVAPLWPGDDAVDWVFINVFEKGKKHDRVKADFPTMLRASMQVLRNVNRSNHCHCVPGKDSRCRGCDLASKPWGLGAFASQGEPEDGKSGVDPAARVRFLRDAAASMAAHPELKAYLYFDSQESEVPINGSEPEVDAAFRDYLASPQFAAGDAGAPPRRSSSGSFTALAPPPPPPPPRRRTPPPAPVVTRCTNDSSCLAHGGGAWQCVPAAAAGRRHGGGGSGPTCHINGHQVARPDGTWAWPGATCVCVNASCHHAHGPSPPPPPGGQGLRYACAAGRCMRVERGGVANSSGTCEWGTGCVALRPNEWIAAKFEWRVSSASSTAITCVHDHTFLKKSQLQSTGLPPSQKLAVKTGTVVALTGAPKAIPNSQYWLVACAEGSLCGSRGITTGGTTSSPSSPSAAASPPTAGLPPDAQVASSLPSYLMIGDSISLGYLDGVQKRLAGKYRVIHSPGNAGNMNKISHDLQCFLEQLPAPADAVRARASVVTFNAGIHDMARGQEWLSLADYAALMKGVSARLARAAAGRVIFVTTTPVPSNLSHPTTAAVPEGILEEDVLRYNAAATAVAKQHGIEVLDLHRVVIGACGGGQSAPYYATCPGIQELHNPHFLAPGWELLAAAVADAVAPSSASVEPLRAHLARSP
jgi:hypothetical protein